MEKILDKFEVLNVNPIILLNVEKSNLCSILGQLWMLNTPFGSLFERDIK